MRRRRRKGLRESPSWFSRVVIDSRVMVQVRKNRMSHICSLCMPTPYNAATRAEPEQLPALSGAAILARMWSMWV